MGKDIIKKKTELDGRSREDILRFIETASRQYTPEWRFDRENPDAGTALANVYADMFTKVLARFNRVLQKNRIEFFNSIHASVLPPVPSSGYAVFGLVNDSVDGVEIPAGMKVYANGADGDVAFATEDDLYVTPARLEAIYQVCDSKDVIRRVYTSQSPEMGVFLFDMSGENLQKHELYFSSDTLLDIRHDATIELLLYVRGNVMISNELVRCLLQRENAVFEYYSDQGWEELRPALSNSGSLLFYKNEFAPAFSKTLVSGQESFWIRCRILKIDQFEHLSFERFYLTVKGVYLPPDVIYGNGIECNIAEYMPFGERFGLYNEVYFACDEALSKRGSQIDFSFTMDFVRVPLTDAEAGNDIEWNWIMKKSDFKVDKEYDLTIEEVLWEYYNGSGWSRLFHDSSYDDIFTTEQGVRAQFRTMRFECPQDIEPVLVNSREACYIRARVIKINNLYKNKGYYVVPVLSDTSFSYDYAKNPKMPSWIYTCNNLESKLYKGSEPGGEKGWIKPFEGTGVRWDTVYMGFSRPLDEGPIKILFTLQDSVAGNNARLLWEYYNGRNFKEINLVDETKNFSKTGIVTMMGSKDFKKCRLFGQELFWIRIVDEGGYFFRNSVKKQYPYITNIHMNSVKVTNVDVEEQEYFTTDRYEENKTLTLLHPHVIDLCVWVDEADHLSERQREELRDERDVEFVWTPDGTLDHAWVRWDETEDFIGANSQSRCFCIDRNAGIITFGNGRYGRIIPASRRENIRVYYRCGGGERTNFPAYSINRMEYAIGFVNSVTNPHRLLGGCDQETLEEAITRCSGFMRSHYKAVTAEDFEQLALCASRSIKRVKCFTGYDDRGERQPGAMTLVVLQKEFESGRYAFNDIKDTVYRYLTSKISGHLNAFNQLYVREPEFIEINIRLEVTAGSFNTVFQMKKEIEDLLCRFLDPLSGHFDGNGWQIGSLPTVIQIQNRLRNVQGVKYIKSIYISACAVGGGGREEVDLKKIRKLPFILPINGSHNIIIRVE